MSAETGTARNGEVSRYYKCYGKKKTSKCKKGNVKREVIEKAVVDSIIEAFNKADLNQIAENIMQFNKEKIKTNNRINLLLSEKTEIYYKYQTTKSPDDKSQGFLFYKNISFYQKTRVVKNDFIKKTNFKDRQIEVFHHF